MNTRFYFSFYPQRFRVYVGPVFWWLIGAEPVIGAMIGSQLTESAEPYWAVIVLLWAGVNLMLILLVTIGLPMVFAVRSRSTCRKLVERRPYLEYMDAVVSIRYDEVGSKLIASTTCEEADAMVVTRVGEFGMVRWRIGIQSSANANVKDFVELPGEVFHTPRQQQGIEAWLTKQGLSLEMRNEEVQLNDSTWQYLPARTTRARVCILLALVILNIVWIGSIMEAVGQMMDL